MTVSAQDIPLAQEGLAAFGTDPWWLVVGKIIAIFLFLNLMTVFTINYERKVVGRMQHRPGPNRNGPNGWLQSLADGLKLIFKEEIIPRTADKVVYFIAPVISAIAAFVGFAIIPLGPEVSVFGHTTPLQVTDTPVGVLVLLAASAMGVYGVVLAGWSSGSTYPLLGGLRSAAQMISYEVAMGLSLVAVFMTAGTISTSEIVAAQAHGQRYDVFGVTLTGPSWYALLLFPSFVIFAIAIVGETNRAPFDLPEAESELVGGFQTEYSSIKFMMFYLAEYIAMITMSALAITLFLGGWMAPWPLSLIPGVNEGWWPVLWFVGKLLILLFGFVWLRGTLPRLRYDQFMHFGWKVLVPVNLVWILVVAGVKVLADERSQPAWLLAGSAVTAVALLVLLWPKRRPVEVPVSEIDTGAGGFPIPPLDLVVPPSPRARRLTAERAAAGSRIGGEHSVAGKEG